MRSLLILALAALLATGCALSPQTLVITPTLNVTAENLGNGRSVKVLATDARTSEVIGTRGGVYEKTSVVRTGNDIADALRRETLKGLLAQGFVDGGNEAAIQVRVRLAELAYVVPAGAVATSADLRVALEITAERDGARHAATYRSEVNRRFPVAPTTAQNEAWLNELVAETLQRFFTDTRMRAFLLQ
jgi:uncharacterized lipoprotein